MLDVHGRSSPLDDLSPVADAAEVRRLIDRCASVHVADRVKQYADRPGERHPQPPDLRLGASPRATLHLIRAAPGAAPRWTTATTCSPTTSRTLAVPVLAHRLLPTAEAQIGSGAVRGRSSSEHRGLRCRCPSEACDRRMLTSA